MKSSDLVLFSQASADIRHVLALYKANQGQRKITIFVVKNIGSYNFFCGLSLDAEVIFIPLVSVKKPLSYLSHCFYLRRLWKECLSSYDGAEVHFFANSYDYVTAYCIEKLMLHNNVSYLEIYGYSTPRVNGWISRLKEFVFKLTLGIDVVFFKFGSTVGYKYCIDTNRVKMLTYGGESLDLGDFVVEYDPGQLDKPALLLLESNEVESKHYLCYAMEMEKILHELSKFYTIYVKPHPRLGCSAFLRECQVEVLELDIPAELLDFRRFSKILGVYSSALATIEHPAKYSIIDLLSFQSEKNRQDCKSYIDNLSELSIEYISSLSDLSA